MTTFNSNRNPIFQMTAPLRSRFRRKPGPSRDRQGATILALFLLFCGASARAQNSSDLREILTRLDRLEKDNRSLTDEVRALRKELADLHGATSDGLPGRDRQGAVAAEPAEDRAAVQQSRVEELAQTKVESSQKFPIRVTGMALFNAYVNGRHNNQSVNPTIASFASGDATGGGTLRQSTLGLLFNGPLTVGGAKVSGSLYMDFFGGSSASALRRSTSIGRVPALCLAKPSR